MTTNLLPALGGSAMTLLLQALARVVRRDGYGHRTPPAGTRHWSAGTTVEDPRVGRRA